MEDLGLLCARVPHELYGTEYIPIQRIHTNHIYNVFRTQNSIQFKSLSSLVDLPALFRGTQGVNYKSLQVIAHSTLPFSFLVPTAINHGSSSECLSSSRRPPGEKYNLPLRCRRYPHPSSPGKSVSISISSPKKLCSDSVSYQTVSPAMLQLLSELRHKCAIGFVGGSDLVKQQEQLGTPQIPVTALFDFCFAENGLTAYRLGEQLASQSFIGWLGEERYKKLVNFVLRYLADVECPVKRGTFVEFRYVVHQEGS